MSGVRFLRSSGVGRLATTRSFSNWNKSQGRNKNKTNSAWGKATRRLAGVGCGLALAGGSIVLAQAQTTTKQEVDWIAVRKTIAKILDSNLDYDDGSYGPVFVRLAWHAAGTYDKKTNTGGSNGATMRYGPESTDSANAGLEVARKLLEGVKAKFPGASYADIWTLAGVVAVEEMGGPKVPWRPGRADHADNSKVPQNGRLPDAAQGQEHIRQVFYRMGFNDQEIVALLGAHTLGRCHLDRSGYFGPWTRAPTTFSNEFYHMLKAEKWSQITNPKGKKQFENPAKDLMMLPADLALVADPEFKKWVEVYAKDQGRFFDDFSKAFSKLLELGVPFDQKVQAQVEQKSPASKPADTKPSFFKRLFG